MNAKILMSLVVAIGLISMGMGAAAAATPSSSASTMSVSGNAFSDDVGTTATCTNEICCIDSDNDGEFEECWEQ